jgi:hypothetical protein
MNKSLRLPVVAVVVAIVVNAVMDGIGLSSISFASLFPLTLIFWGIQRLPRKSMGIALGKLPHYGMALLHPILIVGAIAIIAMLSGVFDTSQTNWLTARSDFLSMVVMSIVLGMLTEEGFFRGWLYGSLQSAGLSEFQVVLWTAIAFSLWHIPAVSMNTEDALPLAQIPVLLINGVIIGVIWGMLRSISGSILVTSVCHAVWNACVYVFFGFGTTIGALGIRPAAVYGPESGFWGLGLNLVLVTMLWQWWQHRQRNQPGPSTT